MSAIDGIQYVNEMETWKSHKNSHSDVVKGEIALFLHCISKASVHSKSYRNQHPRNTSVQTSPVPSLYFTTSPPTELHMKPTTPSPPLQITIPHPSSLSTIPPATARPTSFPYPFPAHLLHATPAKGPDNCPPTPLPSSTSTVPVRWAGR